MPPLLACLGTEPSQAENCRPFLDEAAADPVQHQHVLLVGGLQGDETHMGAACRFTDGFCVQPVVLHVLTAFTVGRGELRGDQADFMAERA